jgi:ammonia channel protein AmtB
VVGQRGHQDAQHDGPGFAKARRQHQRQQLGLVAHFGERDDAGRDQKSFHLFILLGAIMVLAMHAGFAFLELGTVRKKNQVNALVKILVDFSVSTVAYFFIGYGVAYGTSFFAGAEQLAQKNGYDLVKFFFLLTFAAAIPAIVSGGIAERARFGPQLAATGRAGRLRLPLLRGHRLEPGLRHPGLDQGRFGEEFHDFAGSVVVHAVGGWIGLPPCCCWARGATATARTAAFRRTRPRASPSWRWAPGSSSSAGSASTS